MKFGGIVGDVKIMKVCDTGGATYDIIIHRPKCENLVTAVASLIVDISSRNLEGSWRGRIISMCDIMGRSK